MIHCGDCLDVLRTMPDESIDAIVTDPPYGLSFMGKRWDYDVPSVEIWQECLRVLKPGGHLLAFAGTRTQHRMCVRIEDAGFEIRDMIAWVYGSGFPKSHDVSKAIDKAAGAEREIIGIRRAPGMAKINVDQGAQNRSVYEFPETSKEPATDAARQWQGWGTALKPALEPITVARKPLIGTVAANVMRYGTGAINVDGCRVGMEGGTQKGSKPQGDGRGIYGAGLHGACEIKQLNAGRWPANLIHDGSDEVTGLFPETKNGGQNYVGGNRKSIFGNASVKTPTAFSGDSGSAARFFYCAKASKRDRDEGLDLPEATPGEKTNRTDGSDGITPYAGSRSPTRNIHPTVKPTDLMRYLCRLVTPSGGTVLDPFMGSGSTGKAAVLEGFDFVGIERNPDYVKIAMSRIAHVAPEKETEDEAVDQLALFP